MMSTLGISRTLENHVAGRVAGDSGYGDSDRGSSGYVDLRTLMRIKNLQMRARVIVEGFYAGIHRSPYHGFSVEFSEYRQYTPGDDLRYFDWRLYARSDRSYVKRFEDETNLYCYLLADLSRSMSFGSGTYTKCDYARTLAATLSYFLYQQRDAVGLVTFDERVIDYLPPRYRPGHLRRLVAMLEHEPGGKSTDLAGPLEQIAQTVRKRGLVVLVSDLLAEPPALRTKLSYLRARGHDVVVFRVLDPAELDFSFAAPSMFLDLETSRKVYIDPAAAREQYQRRFGAHARQLRDACRGLGVDLIEVSTERPLELALFDLLRARLGWAKRSRRGRIVETNTA
jgi:uncharacterized protein (DUF58 family)